MIDEIIWIGTLYAMLFIMHFMTSGKSDWIAYLYTFLLLVAVIMYLIDKFIELGANKLNESDNKYWSET